MGRLFAQAGVSRANNEGKYRPSWIANDRNVLRFLSEAGLIAFNVRQAG
jgi:hypothetical protein